MEAKKFPDISFYSIPKGSRADFFLYRNAQAMIFILIFPDKKDEVLWGKPPSQFHHLPEILRKGDSLPAGEFEWSLH